MITLPSDFVRDNNKYIKTFYIHWSTGWQIQRHNWYRNYNLYSLFTVLQICKYYKKYTTEIQ